MDARCVIRRGVCDRLIDIVAAGAMAFATAAHAENLSFDGNVATGVTTHTINATDWADYVGGSPTFNEANGWGRLYWRGSAGDGQYMHFNLSSLSDLTLVAPVTVTLQNANATWGGGVNGSYVATANGAWTAARGAAVPGATAIANAVNATGSYGSGSSVSWGIGFTTFQNFVDDPSSLSNGLAIIGGSGSQLHFTGPTSPFLTAQTGSLSSATGIITANTGPSPWNTSNYAYVGSDAYSPTLNTLTINGSLGAGSSGAGTLTVNNGGTVAVNQAGAYNYLWALDGTTINAGGRLTSNGHSNIQGLTLAGGELASTGVDGTYGSWGIAGPTNVTGGVTSTISAQQVTLSNGNFSVDAGSTLNFTGSTRSDGSVIKNGAGTMRVTGYQNYTGGTTINAGTLELVGQNGGYGWLRGAVTVNAGGTLAFTGGDGTGFGWNSPVNNLTIDGGSFAATGGSHVGFGSYTTVSLRNGGTITGNGQWNGDGGLGFSSSGDSTNTLNGSWNLRSDSGANHTFNVADGAAAVDLQAGATFSDQYPEVWWVSASALVKTGAGTMVLSGNNSYNGSTTITAGTLVADSATALGDGGAIVFGGGTLRYTASSAGQDWATRITNSTAAAISLDTNGQSVTLAGVIGSSNVGGLTKTGLGSLTLSGVNTYAGGTVVNAGTLVAGNVSAFGSGGITLASGATLNLNNLAITNTITNNGGTIIGALSYTGTTAVASGTSTLANVGGTVDIDAAGVADLSGAIDAVVNVNNGGRGRALGQIKKDVTVGGGSHFDILDGASIDNGSNFAFTNNGEMHVDRTSDLTIAKSIHGNGLLKKSGSGRLDLTGDNSLFSGSTEVDGGVLSVSGTLGGAVTVNNGGTLKGSGATFTNEVTIAGGVHSPGSSPGTQTFASGLTYSGSSTLTWELIANTASGAGTNFDLLTVTGGDLSIASGSLLALEFLNTGTTTSTVDWNDAFWSSNQSWTIIDFASSGTATGDFTLAGDPSTWLDSGSTSLASVRSQASFSVATTPQGDVVLNYVAVPEPSTIMLAGVGVAMASWGIRNRRRIASTRPQTVCSAKGGCP